jgi:membrane-bound serine protease (ClpP class)
VEWVVDAVRDSVAIGETEALELGVIDLIAENKRELLEAIQGRVVELGDGSEITLDVATAEIEPFEMSTLQQLFNFLADPNVAVVLFLAGLIGIYIEVNNPGLILPGVAGGVCLILAAIAFQILPFSWVGLLLVLAGIGLLVAEIFVPSLGVLFALGLGCILLGGTMLFDRPDLSDLTVSFWRVLVPAVAGVAVFGGFVVFAVARSLSRSQQSGVSELIGLRARAVTPLDPGGKVFVRGEYWNVDADEQVGDGEWVEVVAVEGLRLRVRRVVGRN